MIPLRLSLKNFMSYGEERTSLDFSGMHVACLSGDNGNGKSALLDAITYALWGKTRVSGSQASSEDDLIRLGADEMEVTYEFLLNEARYRVIRKRNRRTRTGDWQVFVADPDGSWRSVGGAGIRETERNLTHLLHMEYETFLNSAYIQQGHADEFTRNKPDARKRILSDILGLRRYDRLEEMAKERRSESDMLLRDLDGEIRFLEARLQEETQNRQRLLEKEKELASLAQVTEDAMAKLNDLQIRLGELEKKSERLQEREKRLREYEQDTEEHVSQTARLAEEIDRASVLLKDKPAITQDYEKLCEYRDRIKALEPVIQTLYQMQTESDKLANDIKVCQQKTTAEYEQMALLCRQASDRQKKIEAIDLELSEIANELATRTDIEQQKAQLQSDLEQKNRTISEYVAALNQMKSEVEELVEVIEVLKQPRSNCPVCESDLSGDRQARVRERQEKKRADILSRMSEIKKRGVIVRSERDTVQEQLKEIEKTLNNLTGLHEKSKQLRIQREELKEQNRLRVEWEAQARKLKEMLDKEEYGAEERARLRVLKLERDKLKAQEQEYQDAQRSVALLTERQVERRHTQLEEAERCHSQRIETHSQLQAKLKQRLERISEERKQQEMLRQELIEIPVIQSEKRQAEQQFRESAKEKEQTQSEVIRLQKALEDCEKARTQLTQKRSERDRLAREKQAYTDLAAAFGKKGIQAHIIENALPEIEAEANRLLSRMTDNAMQVTLSTLRQGRTTGQQIETLDIAITDDAGTRPYEMYSGGEAFRVNFALRIALSRILTRRAGASLQTLILDEGFGTQDIKGRDRLVEAIQSVKEEFSLILVISHIEALKDAFPTRIEIIKTPLGSQINYLE